MSNIAKTITEDLQAVRDDTVDLVDEYKKLDPSGEFFTENAIHWDDMMDEPVATEIICGLAFPRLLGDRPAVPDVDRYYVPLPEHVEGIRAATLTGQNIMLTGPAGSGKSSICQQLAARCNRPFFVADIHEDFRPDTLYGEFRPTPDKALVWQDGPLAKALKTKGSIFLLDEFNFATPGVLAMVHRAYAGYEVYQIENNSKRIDRAKGVLLFAAGNAVNNVDEAQLHAGIQNMNRAFLDRFGVTIVTDYPTPEQECDIIQGMIKSKFPDRYNTYMKKGLKKYIMAMIQTANILRKQINDGSLAISLSIRRTSAWATLFAYYWDMTKATHQCLLNIEDKADAMTIDAIVKQQFGDEYTNKYK